MECCSVVKKWAMLTKVEKFADQMDSFSEVKRLVRSRRTGLMTRMASSFRVKSGVMWTQRATSAKKMD